jgi:hypothetical protein
MENSCHQIANFIEKEKKNTELGLNPNVAIISLFMHP